jgi:phosphoglycerate dehydrogenase-like enzyme
MNVLIGVISRVPAWVLPRASVERLRADFPQHTFVEAWDRESIRRALPDVDVALTPFVDPDVLPLAHRLRWVQCPAAGVNHLLTPAMIDSPVAITSASGIRAAAMAEHVLGMTIALFRQLQAAIRHQLVHRWAQDQLEAGDIRTLRGRRMGIVGLGSIGLEVARRAVAFGMTVSAVRRRARLDRVEAVDEILPPERLHDLLSRSDVVVLTAPLTAATEFFIDGPALAAMRPGSFLINVARGRLVNDTALVEALREGRIGGAALDVFTREPLDSASPYWDLPNVIVTPHTSGTMEDYWTPLIDLFSANLRRFEAGQPLLNIVDKHAGY